jgi:hypothetical protein
LNYSTLQREYGFSYGRWEFLPRAPLPRAPLFSSSLREKSTRKRNKEEEKKKHEEVVLFYSSVLIQVIVPTISLGSLESK